MKVAHCHCLIRSASREHEGASGVCPGLGHPGPALASAVAGPRGPRAERSPKFLRHQHVAGVGSPPQSVWPCERQPCPPVLVNALEIPRVLAHTTSVDLVVPLSVVTDFGIFCRPVQPTSYPSCPSRGAAL